MSLRYVTMMSFVNVKCGAIAAESLPWELRSVINFCGQKDIVQMPFTLRCLQCMVTSVLRDQQFMFGVRSLLVHEKVL